MSVLHAVFQEHQMPPKKSSQPLPHALIPFILQNLDGFDVVLEDGERIVILPRAGATVESPSALHGFVERREGERAVSLSPSSSRAPTTAARQRFLYTAKDATYTVEHAKRFGMTKPRLKVYEAIFTSGAEGADYRTLRQKTHLEHGSVMQVLHWLRKQNLITAVTKGA